MCIKSSKIYSPPLSYLNILILSPEAFSIKALSSENFSHTSELFLRKKTHVYLEKSSIKVRRYLYPFMNVIGIGTMISECIIPNMHVARFALPRSNLLLRMFSNHTALANSCGCLDDQEAFNHGFFL